MNLQEFQQKLDFSDKPIVVDFWAPWCGPCKMTKPVLDKLGKEFAENVEFIPVNADNSREILQAYRVLSIPTVIAIKNGKEAVRITGAQHEAGYCAMFESLATGQEIKIPVTQFERMLRLGAGGLLVLYGLPDSNWFVVGIGAIIAFLGIYDRCPIWNMLTRTFQRK